MKPPKLCTRAVEFRAASEEGDGRTLEGYAAVFNVPTQIASWEGTFEEKIARGAFAKTIAERKPVLQFDHGHDARTGSVPIGKIEQLNEDRQGLHIVARMFDNPVVEPIRQAIEGGAISGMSFRFRVVRDEWRDNANKLVKGDDLGRLLYDAGDRGPLCRTIREVELFEAGPVVFPAYEQTSVGVRAAAEDVISDEVRAEILAEYLRSAIDEEPEPMTVLISRDDEGNVVARRGDEQVVIGEAGPELPEEERENVPETGTPEDAAPAGTSEGHEEETERAKPVQKRVVPQFETRKESVPMTTVAEMRARLVAISTRMGEIDGEFADAALTEERQGEWDGLEAEVETLKGAIDKAEKRAAYLQNLAVSSPAHVEAGSDRGAPAFHKKPDNIYDMNALRSSARSDDEFREALRDNAMRAVEKARFAGGVRNAREGMQEQVEYLLDSVDDDRGTLARRILATGSPQYERAFGKVLKSLDPNTLSAEERTYLSLGTDGAGGYAVPFQLDPSVILTATGTLSPIRQIARVEQIVGKEWQGITSAGVTVSRDAESSEVSDDSPTFAQPVIRPTRVAGFVAFSMELDQDWGALRGEVSRMLADAKKREEDVSFVTGDGTPPNPGGVIATLSGNTVAPATDNVFAVADVYAMENAADPRWRPGASFLANKATYNKIRQFDTAGGAGMWERIGAGQPPELLGYPAYEASAMTAVTPSDGQKILLFGDFSNFLIVDRVGMQVELVPHVLGSNRRPTGERGIYAIWRNSSKILVHSAFKLLVL